MSPVRLQRKRTKGAKLPSDCIMVTRPGRFSNPMKVGMFAGYTAADAVRDFRRWIDRDLSVRSFEGAFGKPPSCEEIRRELRGRDLACWCKLDQPCHADVLLEIANDPAIPPAERQGEASCQSNCDGRPGRKAGDPDHTEWRRMEGKRKHLAKMLEAWAFWGNLESSLQSDLLDCIEHTYRDFSPAVTPLPSREDV